MGRSTSEKAQTPQCTRHEVDDRVARLVRVGQRLKRERDLASADRDLAVFVLELWLKALWRPADQATEDDARST